MENFLTNFPNISYLFCSLRWIEALYVHFVLFITVGLMCTVCLSSSLISSSSYSTPSSESSQMLAFSDKMQLLKMERATALFAHSLFHSTGEKLDTIAEGHCKILREFEDLIFFFLPHTEIEQSAWIHGRLPFQC